MIYDALIIGAGPAGMTAAIYLKRANLEVGIIEKAAPGGKITQTFKVENYPGFKAISGPDLALEMYSQVQALNIPHLYGNVLDVKKENNLFDIITETETYQTRRLICATGTVSRTLNVPGELEYYGHGISFCAICDGFFYRDKEVAVIGGGNSAFEESIYLARIAKHVHIINRSDKYRADAMLVDDVQSIKNITIHNNTTVSEFYGDGRLQGIILNDLKNQMNYRLEVSGVFIYIGFDPATSYLKNLDVLNGYGYIVVNEDLETKVPGLFGAGDCLDKKIRQIATAVGDGALAGSNIIKSLHKK